MATNSYYDGPRSDHFDGTLFFIEGAAQDKTSSDLFRMFRTPFAPWPKHVGNPAPAPVLPRVDGGALRVTSIGHATHLIQTRGLNILIDPVWADRASPVSFIGPKRATAPGLSLDALPPLDAILITHNHYDHLDLATLGALGAPASGPSPRLIVPLGNDTIIQRRHPTLRAEPHDWGDRVPLSTEVAVTLTPSYHWSARRLGDRRMALWTAFVIETPDGAIYHVGDTAYRDGRIFREIPARFGPPRLAILPIGAYEPRWFMRDQHVEPFESVRILLDCQAHHALAHHWGTFRLTAEAREDPPKRLAAALAEQGLATERFRVQHPGEAFDVPSIG